MSEQSDSRIDGLDLEQARRIDAVCRSFEADWRAGKQPHANDYLPEVPQKARTLLRSELEALECELRQLEEESRSTSPLSPTAECANHRSGRPANLPGRRRGIASDPSGRHDSAFIRRDDRSAPRA